MSGDQSRRFSIADTTVLGLLPGAQMELASCGWIGSRSEPGETLDSFSEFLGDRASDPDGRAVVVVEDNAGDIYLIREVVGSANREVKLYFMTDGDAALRFFGQVEAGSVRCPDVLLLDINIPNTNGF